jgi:hypothetical protein
LGAIVRDEEHYVQEWLTFYYLVGVERMVICLHCCSDDTEQKIRKLPFFDTHIKLYCTSFSLPAQIGVYRNIIAEYGQFTKWLMFVDADEFYFGTQEDSLPKILENYEGYGGLAAVYIMFGTNGNIRRPNGLLIESLTERLPLDSGYNRSVKSISRACEILTPLTSHVCLTRLPTVTEYKDDRFIGPYGLIPYKDALPSWDIVRCNHYYVRSMEDWVAKARRGSCNLGEENKDIFRSQSSFQTFRDFCGRTEEDRTILRFAPRIKEILE